MGKIGNKIKTNDKEKQAYAYYLSRGWTAPQAAAIVGNLLHESGLNTSAEGDIGYKGGSSRGIAQFRGERLNKLKSRYGDNWTDFNNQLEFVDWELNNTHKSAGQALRNTNDIYDAGRIVSDKYEIPAVKFKANKDRQAKVFNTYNKFSGFTEDPSKYTQKYLNSESVNNTPSNIVSLVETPNFIPSEENANNEISSINKDTQEELTAKENINKVAIDQQLLQDYFSSTNKPQVTQEIQQNQQTSEQFPLLLDQYAQVSQIVDNPIAQEGGATRQDSLNLYNNSRRVQNFYEKENYKTSDSYIFNDKINDGLIHKENDKVYNHFSSLKPLLVNPSIKQRLLGIEKEDYRKNIDKNKYYQRELATGKLNMDSPMQLFDRRIQPLTGKVYRKDGDHVEVASYNNIGNKPFDMLTKAERIDRIKLYGRNGVPESYGKTPLDIKNKINSSSLPVDTVTKLPNLKALDSLRQQGLVQFSDDSLNSNVSIPNQYLQPKYWDVQDSVNQNFGGTQTNYRVYPETANDMLRTLAPEPYNSRISTPQYQSGGSIDSSKEFLQNWYPGRVLPDPALNEAYQKEKNLYIQSSKNLPDPNYVGQIDEFNTQGTYEPQTGQINLLKTATPLVYTHEGTHKINLPLKDTQSNVNAFSIIGQNILPQERIQNQWVKDNYKQISNYQEVIPRLNSYRQLHGLKPDQVITPELIQKNREMYQTGQIPFEDNTDQLYKLFENEGLSNVLNKVVSNDNIGNYYVQQGGEIENNKWLTDWFSNRVIPNKELQDSYLEDKSFYLDRLDKIPGVNKVDKITDDPRITGRYDGNLNKMYLTPSATSDTYLHELNHYANYFNSFSRGINNQVISKNIIPRDNLPEGVYKDKYDYFSNPDEVHSRIQVLRKNAGIKPDQVVTPEFLRDYLKTYKGDSENINDLLNISNEGQLIEMLNLMADNGNNSKTYVQQGGQIPVSSNGVYDFPMQEVIVPTKNGNITMSNVNYPILGIDEYGNQQLMMPGQDYKFPGKTIYEIPQLKNYFNKK